jgi:hypothetical protein
VGHGRLRRQADKNAANVRAAQRESMKIFWSWQSDTHGKIGRHFIRDTLDAAVAEMKADLTLDEAREREALVALHVDQDRQGSPGSVDLVPEILKKIDESGIVIADVTLTGVLDHALGEETEEGRRKHFINSNVAIELGYAYRAKGNSFVLLVMNDHYGNYEDLPFDLRHKGGTIGFTLAPSASKTEIADAGRTLKRRFFEAIKLCLSARIAEETASSPVPGLLALGPEILCEGDILGFDQSEWKLHLRDFVAGDVNTLIRFVEGFDQSDMNDRYVLLDALGDGRRLMAAPSLTKDGNSFIATCPISPSFPRKDAQKLGSTMAVSPETGDLFVEKGSIARVAGVAAMPQAFRSTLSLIRGESPIHLTYGSRLQEYYWRFREDKRLEAILKLEVIRQAAIPYGGPANDPEHTPLQCVERVQSVRVLSDAPVSGSLPLSLELDVKGLGRVEQKISVIMPPAEKVEELSKKGEAMSIFSQGPRQSAAKRTAPKPDPRLARNLRRLSVVTRRWDPDGLELEIRYQPESEHIGMSARVTLLSPENGTLKPGVPKHNPAPTIRGYVIYRPGEPFRDRSCSVQLTVDLKTLQTTVRGIVFVFPPEADAVPLRMAKVRIEVKTDAGEKLVSQDLDVSALQ